MGWPSWPRGARRALPRQAYLWWASAEARNRRRPRHPRHPRHQSILRWLGGRGKGHGRHTGRHRAHHRAWHSACGARRSDWLPTDPICLPAQGTVGDTPGTLSSDSSDSSDPGSVSSDGLRAVYWFALWKWPCAGCVHSRKPPGLYNAWIHAKVIGTRVFTSRSAASYHWCARLESPWQSQPFDHWQPAADLPERLYGPSQNSCRHLRWCGTMLTSARWCALLGSATQEASLLQSLTLYATFTKRFGREEALLFQVRATRARSTVQRDSLSIQRECLLKTWCILMLVVFAPVILRIQEIQEYAPTLQWFILRRIGDLVS